jgi:FAD/FMN-containing dehydrogenase
MQQVREPVIAPGRRTFLVGLGTFAAAAPLLSQFPGQALAASLGGSACPPPSAWSDLAKQLSNGVVLPADPFYADYARPNNLRYGGTLPMGIARCANANDVRACINWVRKMGNIPFAIRSGGHNYAGFCTTSGLLIDMAPMAGVTEVPNSGGLVTIQGGTVNNLAYKEMERLGRTITHGRCDSVGAAGFLLGGGIGFDMRKYGMASDLLRSTKLVTANGEITPANERDNRDLFWACRGGGGGNFGVSTEFTVQSFPVEKVTVFELTWKKNLEDVLYRLLRDLAKAPDDFGSKISVTMPSTSQRCQGTGMSMSILGQLHNGTAKDLAALFGKAWDEAEVREVKESVPYWVGQEFLAETTYPYYYQEKSSYMTADRINPTAIGKMFEWATVMPATAMATSFKFFQVGGAINRTPPNETAYVHRGFDWLFTVEANWWLPTDSQARVDEILAWQNGFYEDINRKTGASGAFQNFSDPSLRDWQTAYYGDNYKRLAQVKKQVDPAKLFNFAQAIQPA